RRLEELGGDAPTADVGQRSIFMDIYAAMARRHMQVYGTTQEQIAAVAAKNHAHGAHNERAHYRRPMSVEEVLAARPLAYPITVPMCSPLTDGAAAVVVCDGTLGRGRARAVRVLASTVGSGVQRAPQDYGQHISKLVATRAYEQAGIGP